MSKSKDYPRSDIAKLKQTIKSLKSKCSQKDRKIDRLLSDVKTLQAALDNSIVYINEKLESIPVEDIVRYFNRKKAGKLEDVKDEHMQEIDRLKEKWRCFSCRTGYLRLVVMSRHDGQYYFRACVNENCNRRTELKSYHSEVDGLE